MAKFEVVQQEGVNFVKIDIEDEMVQAERGALCWMNGEIEMDAKIPFLGRVVKAYLSEESFIRPTFTGRGTIYLESSLGGFHIFDTADEHWVLSGGAYWASEGSVSLTVQRESMWNSFWVGEGLIDWQTRLEGRGKVVVCTQGPVDEIILKKGEHVVANGNYVPARTAGISYQVKRATKTVVGGYASGEGYCRWYEGPGRLFLSATPYWRYRLFNQRPTQPSRLEATE